MPARPKTPGWCWVKRGVKSRKKESEQTVAPALLSQLELAGKVVTGDALYAQRELSRYVVERAETTSGWSRRASPR